jgi:hypothetical protein
MRSNNLLISWDWLCLLSNRLYLVISLTGLLQCVVRFHRIGLIIIVEYHGILINQFRRVDIVIFVNYLMKIVEREAFKNVPSIKNVLPCLLYRQRVKLHNSINNDWIIWKLPRTFKSAGALGITFPRESDFWVYWLDRSSGSCWTISQSTLAGIGLSAKNEYYY